MQIDVFDGMSRNIISDDERIDEINENLRLIQKKNGLVFGTDAYLLSAYVKGKRNAVAADLGSGTGVAAFLLAVKEKAQTVHAYEIQETFATLIERNTALNGLDGRIVTHHTDVREAGIGDIGAECDIVICNPPYMKTDTGKRNEHDAKYIARHEVCGGIWDFCAAAKRLLKYGGSFYCIYRPDRLIDLICAMRENLLEAKYMTFVHADRKSESSLVIVEARYGGGASLKVTSPLFMYDTAASDCARALSADAQAIYDTCSFEHLKRQQNNKNN